ncbi:interactor of constitutive active ROPs 4-like [Bidens hawaiensis]|uniref:interactor of constitutive active ROPs 4-like n=1 Tax=Bidens hawaiensis TaxID=980011 RepID=UPI00404B7047
MPRVRGSEMAPRVSTRGPGSHRLSGSDSDPSHRRVITERSPKVGDRRSPKSVLSEPLTQKKLGTRIAGLETQLEQAQGELKLLKDQLASVEAAKKEAQKELETKAIKPVKPIISVPAPAPEPVTRSSPSEKHEEHDRLDDNLEETDVFEVPIEMVSQSCDQDEVKVKVNDSTKLPDNPGYEEEINSLKLMIEEKDKKLETFSQENEDLKHKLSEANVKISSALVNEEKLTIKLTQVDQQLTKSKNEEIKLKEKLKEIEVAKEAMEIEMKKLRVQTEQWRKAADAAAAILSGGVEMGGRVSERCGSMDKNYGGGVFEGFVGSPGLGDDSDDGFGNSGKKKGSGIRMFGDLWKKKGHK